MAVRLADGRVLVVGGDADWPMGPEGILASAELYDPETGQWARTGDMLGRRDQGDAFLLNDGHVLVAGGSTPEPTFTDGEIYNPATGAWTSPWTARHIPWQAAVVRLADGRMLVVGGTDSDDSSGYRDSAELFDPATGTWSATASMPHVCADCRGVLLADGRVLVVGGYSAQGYAIALVFDPLAARWAPTHVPAQNGPLRALVLLHDGRVLAVHDEPLSFELYSPASGSWTKAAGPVSDFNPCSATVLVDGRVLVTATDIYSDRPSWAEIYDPGRGSWSAAGTLAEKLTGLSATLLVDGRVLIAGGHTPGGRTTSVQIFDPARLP
jgi:hypothetical protein